jgi:hypothetical protein
LPRCDRAAPCEAEITSTSFITSGGYDVWQCWTVAEAAMHLRFPVYVLANSEGVLVVNNDGDDCVLLFHDETQAVRHIEETRSLGAKMVVYPLPIPDAESLRQGLESLPSEITCAIWDATLESGEFVSVGIHELLGT